MKMKIIAVIVSMVCLGLVGLTAGPAEAALYPAARIIVLSEDSDVTVTFQPSDAGCNNQFGLWDPARKNLGWGHSTTPGTVFNLGRFPRGTELIFFIRHPCSGNTWLNGPGERNGDGQVHAAISELDFQTWRLGFEDLPGGGDRDFNDIILKVKGNLYIAPPYNNPPVADAGGPDVGYSGDEGSPVTFDASGSSDPDGDPLQYRWDFDGDGVWNTGWSDSPVATYTWDDDWSGTVKVEVSDGEFSATDTASVTIGNVAPTVQAGSDRTADEGEVLSFSVNVTDPGQLDTHTIEWDFGDGSPVVTGTLTPGHVYCDNGVYNVTLTVTDDDGGVGMDTLTVTVNNVPPTANGNGPYSGNEGSPINFTGTQTDPGTCDTFTYEWDFDYDGVNFTVDSTEQNPTNTWGDDALTTIAFRVTDDDEGVSDIYTTSLTVNNVAPTVDAGPDQVVNEGDLVSFSGNFTDPGWLDTHTYAWDFGDGSPVVTGILTPTHAYGDNGVCTITLTVTDDDGGVGIDTMQVTVNNVAPVVDAGSDQTVTAGDTVNFTGSMTDPGWLDTHTYEWDFDASDGIQVEATGQTPTHIYYAAGTYTVTLTVTDDDGGVGTDTLQMVVKPIPVTIDCDPDTLNLKSKGDWITCYIELPPGYDVKNIDASTILLNGLIPPELDPKYGFVKSEESYIMDHDGDGILERMVKFDRAAVQAILSPGPAVTLTLTGKVTGADFEGEDTIRVINPGKK